MKEIEDLEDSALISLGLRKSQTPKRMFTPSPLLTPTVSTNIKNKTLKSENKLLNFDRQLQSPISELLNIKIQHTDDNLMCCQRLPLIEQEQQIKFSNKSSNKRITRSKIEPKLLFIQKPVRKLVVQKQQRRGRKRMYGQLEDLLVQILSIQPMNRIQIQTFAKSWALQNKLNFTASNGWYQKFVNRMKKSNPQIIQNLSKSQTYAFPKKTQPFQNNSRKKFILKY